MRAPTRLAPSLVLLLVLPALAADSAVTDFKKELAAAQNPDAQAKAFDKLKGASSVEAAQTALGFVADPNAHYKLHDAALDALRSMTADTVRAWAQKELAANKDPHARAVIATVAKAWPDGWKLSLQGLKDKDASVISAATDVLVTVREKDVVTALIAALKDAKDPRVVGDLSRALNKLTNQDFTDGTQYESWWKEKSEGFTFPSGDAPPPAESSGVPRTTSNGSGLYETISTNHVMFLIDTSYSMRTTGEVSDTSGTKKTLSRLEYVKAELVAAIEAQLSKKCLFNILEFNTKVTPWKPKLVDASDGNKKAAKAWVLALQPEAETNTYDALELAFADKTVDTIYLLTDGFPTNGKIFKMDDIRGEVRKWNDGRRVRINTICYVVGDGKKFAVVENKDMSKRFMQKLAEENGGFCKVFE